MSSVCFGCLSSTIVGPPHTFEAGCLYRGRKQEFEAFKASTEVSTAASTKPLATPDVARTLQPDTINFEAELDKLIAKYDDWHECEEYHIHDGTGEHEGLTPPLPVLRRKHDHQSI